MTVSIESLTTRLQKITGDWVLSSLPTYPKNGWITFSFNREQFLLAQMIVSGASLGATAEGSVSYLESRQERLHQEAEGNDYYELPMGYCLSGWFITAGDDDVPEILHLWYETTSGTVLCHSVATHEEVFQIYLPIDRAKGSHHKDLERVKAGMTRDQYDRWYGCTYSEGKDEEYAENAEFHNKHLVPLGWKVVPSGEQFIIHRQIDKALHFVHGKWAMEYGIGKNIQDLLGPDGGFYSTSKEFCPPLSGRLRTDEAKHILDLLTKATEKWNELVEEWAKDTSDPLHKERDSEMS